MSKPGVFSGLKVLDAASFIAAPAAATIMADFGADVIKIEPPGEGDAYRGVSFLPGMPISDRDYCWTVDDRNKRSLALDLKRPEARKIVHDLIIDTDVFITNYPPAVRHRLGIAFNQLSHINERLIYASLTAYGEHGAEANKPGFRLHGMVGALRSDGSSATGRAKLAGAVNSRHGRPSDGAGALWRDRHRAFPSRAHRQRRSGRQLAPGERCLGKRLLRPGGSRRRPLHSAAAAQRSPQCALEPLPLR